MHPARRIGVAVVATLIATVTWAQASSAAESLKNDPAGDAPGRFDITSAAYSNTRAAVSVQLTIPELETKGSARLVIGPPFDGDGSLVARVTARPDGSLKRQFFVGTVVRDVPARCSFSATWDVDSGHVFISVPWSCIVREGGTYFGIDRVYLGAATGRAKDFAAPVRRLERG